jgi:hypothetical protein
MCRDIPEYYLLKLQSFPRSLTIPALTSSSKRSRTARRKDVNSTRSYGHPRLAQNTGNALSTTLVICSPGLLVLQGVTSTDIWAHPIGTTHAYHYH